MTDRSTFAKAGSLGFAALLATLITGACADPGPARSRPTTATPDSARDARVQAQFSAWDGSHKGLTRFVKQSLDRPQSYEHVKTTYDDRHVNLVVTMTYRFRGPTGAMEKGTIKAVVDLDGKILEVTSRTP